MMAEKIDYIAQAKARRSGASVQNIASVQETISPVVEGPPPSVSDAAVIDVKAVLKNEAQQAADEATTEGATATATTTATATATATAKPSTLILEASAKLGMYVDMKTSSAMMCIPNGPCRRVSVPATSPRATAYVQLTIHSDKGIILGQKVVTDTLAIAAAKVLSVGTPIHPTETRIAYCGDAIEIDSANPNGEVFEISPAGVTIATETTTKYLRTDAQGAIPTPSVGMATAAAYGLLRGLFESHGIDKGEVVLLIVVLLEYLRPGTPKPILQLIGPPGSAKSTLAEQIVSLIDPTKSGRIPDIKLTGEAFAAVCASGRIMAVIDNASRSLDGEQQDILCKAVTGYEHTDRLYYAQGETFRQEVQLGIVITAITPVITRPDTLSRTITIHVPPKNAYRELSVVRAEFALQRPALIGALYQLLSVGLANLPNVAGAVANKQHRLTDCLSFGEAVLLGVGYAQGRFTSIMDRHALHQSVSSGWGDPFVQGVVQVALRLGAGADSQAPASHEWLKGKTGYVAFAGGDRVVLYIRPETLRTEIKSIGSVLPTTGNGYDPMPQHARGVVPAIQRCRSVLLGLGIDMQEESARGRSFLSAKLDMLRLAKAVDKWSVQ